MPSDEIGVEVGQKHVREPAVEPVRVLDVLVNITLRIDHRRDPTALVGHQIRGVSQAAEVVLLEDHLLPQAGGLGSAVA